MELLSPFIQARELEERMKGMLQVINCLLSISFKWFEHQWPVWQAKLETLSPSRYLSLPRNLQVSIKPHSYMLVIQSVSVVLQQIQKTLFLQNCLKYKQTLFLQNWLQKECLFLLYYHFPMEDSSECIATICLLYCTFILCEMWQKGQQVSFIDVHVLLKHLLNLPLYGYHKYIL